MNQKSLNSFNGKFDKDGQILRSSKKRSIYLEPTLRDLRGQRSKVPPPNGTLEFIDEVPGSFQ